MSNPLQHQIADNEDMQLAYTLLADTARSIFLTGKAGSGKTWFLQQLRENISKSMVVTAPTGVAAMNAGGVTLHSFFQLPFGPIPPIAEGQQAFESKQSTFRFSKRKIEIIQHLELLIIDEISMVRADVLDAVDRTLKRFRTGSNRHAPFGGVQVLMIGDAYQLAPVAKDDEWQTLSPYYDSPYFFSAKAYLALQPRFIEFKRIYRQQDVSFIELLNAVRENRADERVLKLLNTRYQPDRVDDADDEAITLTTHNFQADKINQQKLAALSGDSRSWHAEISGEFPAFLYPTDATLTLKVGAQVMFVKNDSSANKLYYNGKIGQVVGIANSTPQDDAIILVQVPGESAPISVSKAAWTNIKYQLNPETGAIDEEEVGRFTQYPLRLAWAITIHKSQGLTFAKIIIDAGRAFSFGQVYVALSRCQSLEGISLQSPLRAEVIRGDEQVDGFLSRSTLQMPTADDIQHWKREHQQQILRDCLDFSECVKAFSTLKRQLGEAQNRLTWQASSPIDEVWQCLINKIDRPAKAFERELADHFSSQTHADYAPIADEHLQARIKKAAHYFSPLLSEVLQPWLSAFKFQCDNKVLAKQVILAKQKSAMAIVSQTAIWQSLVEGFSPANIQAAKTKALLKGDAVATEPSSPRNATAKKAEYDSAQLAHPNLAEKIRLWRAQEAGELPHFRVLSQKQLIAVAQGLPQNADALMALSGFGQIMADKYGAALIALVHEYLEEERALGRHPIPAEPLPISEKAKTNAQPIEGSDGQIIGNTKEISRALFLQGKTIPEIAQSRGLAQSTIEGHLAKFAGKEIPLETLLTHEKIERINLAINALSAEGADQHNASSPNEPLSLTAIKHHLEQSTNEGDQAITYGEIKFVLASRA